MGKFIDLTGQTFGRLKVIERVENDKFNKVCWLCECQCEKKTKIIVTTGRLRRKDTQSCGCLHKEKFIAMSTKHGKRYSKLYNIWNNMKARTSNPNNDRYENYGKRGIKVCEEWAIDFSTFYDWAINNGYKEGLSIERKDVNGNYCPENCEWIQLKDQAKNKTNTHYIEYNNKTQSLTEWSKETGIPFDTLRARIVTLGWSIDKALETPARPIKNKEKK